MQFSFGYVRCYSPLVPYFDTSLPENYGMALRDCSEALGLNPRSSKAFYRSAKGLFALDRFIEAIDCCDHALLIDETNQEVVKLRSAIVEKSQRFEKLKAEAKERERRAKETKTSLDRAYVVSDP